MGGMTFDRLFMVRLGLIGDEYADTRRILMKDLPGNSAWGTGEKITHMRTPRLEVRVDLPDFTAEEDSGATRRNISFIKQLGYFLIHFDD